METWLATAYSFIASEQRNDRKMERKDTDSKVSIGQATPRSGPISLTGASKGPEKYPNQGRMIY